jgi:hypothetical protein
VTGIDLERIRHDVREAAKFVADSLGTRVLEQDVPQLIGAIEQLRRENAELRTEVRILEGAEDGRLVVAESQLAAWRGLIQLESGRVRDVIEAAKAWRASRVGSWRSADHTLAAAVDALSQCCDLHGRNCEPPSELCCQLCTEASHPEHRDGTTCSAPDLSRSQLAAEEPADA